MEFGTVLSQVDNEGNYVPIGAVQQRGGTVSHDLSYCQYLCSVAPIQWAEIFHGSLELWNYVHVYILMHECANIIYKVYGSTVNQGGLVLTQKIRN